MNLYIKNGNDNKCILARVSVSKIMFARLKSIRPVVTQPQHSHRLFLKSTEKRYDVLQYKNPSMTSQFSHIKDGLLVYKYDLSVLVHKSYQCSLGKGHFLAK